MGEINKYIITYYIKGSQYIHTSHIEAYTAKDAVYQWKKNRYLNGERIFISINPFLLRLSNG